MTTELFARIPLWLSLDGGVRALPAPARVALYDVAAAGGTIRCGAAPHSALEALCAGAGEHLDLLLDRGLVEIDGGRLSLVSPDGALWEGRGSQSSTADAPRVLTGPIEASARRAFTKALGARWSEKGLSTAEARLAWIDSAAGGEYLRTRGVDVETAREIASSAGQRRGVFGRDRSPITRGVSTGVTVSRPSGVTDKTEEAVAVVAALAVGVDLVHADAGHLAELLDDRPVDQDPQPASCAGAPLQRAAEDDHLAVGVRGGGHGGGQGHAVRRPHRDDGGHVLHPDGDAGERARAAVVDLSDRVVHAQGEEVGLRLPVTQLHRRSGPGVGQRQASAQTAVVPVATRSHGGHCTGDTARTLPAGAGPGR